MEIKNHVNFKAHEKIGFSEKQAFLTLVLHILLE